MSFNAQRDQMRRQQEQRRRQQQAWAHEQQKKKKRRKREEKLRQSGGVNITDSELDVGGDIVGRDKSVILPRDEKNGFILFIERFFAFAVSAGVVGAIAVGIYVSSESPIVIVVGAVIALLFGIATASSVSRYRD